MLPPPSIPPRPPAPPGMGGGPPGWGGPGFNSSQAPFAAGGHPGYNIWLSGWTLLRAILSSFINAGSIIEVVTRNGNHEMDVTSFFQIESLFGASNTGVFAEAVPCGASAPTRAVELDLAFAHSEHRAALHFCAGPYHACGGTLAGRVTMHVAEVRIREPTGITEPWARIALRGGGFSVHDAAQRVDVLKQRLSEKRARDTPSGRLAVAAHTAAGLGGGADGQLALLDASPHKRRKRKKKRKSSDSSESSEETPLFRGGSARGVGTIREVARDSPGALFEEALRSIATKLGERVGPTFNLAQPRVTSYLNAVMMIKYPKMSVTMQRELRTIAESLDEIAVGGVAQSADILIQRFKAIEESLKSGGSWRLSRHLEVAKDLARWSRRRSSWQQRRRSCRG